MIASHCWSPPPAQLASGSVYDLTPTGRTPPAVMASTSKCSSGAAIEGEMVQNIYDNPEFFAGYSRLPRQVQGLAGAPEWPAIRAMLPEQIGRASCRERVWPYV